MVSHRKQHISLKHCIYIYIQYILMDIQSINYFILYVQPTGYTYIYTYIYIYIYIYVNTYTVYIYTLFIRIRKILYIITIYTHKDIVFILLTRICSHLLYVIFIYVIKKCMVAEIHSLMLMQC